MESDEVDPMSVRTSGFINLAYRARSFRPTRIMIVSGSDRDWRWLRKQLDLLGEFLTIETTSCDEALELLESEFIEAMLIDVRLPGVGGQELCRLLRRSNCQIPIILLSVSHSDAEAILGLESGASDYIAKPFSMGELVARLRARLREFERTDAAVFEIGPYWFRPAMRLMIHRETLRQIRLTAREAEILKYLYQRAGKPVSREALLRDVWDMSSNVFVSTHTLETHIYRLRQKIERRPDSPVMLITEPGAYRLETQPASASPDPKDDPLRPPALDRVVPGENPGFDRAKPRPNRRVG
jgi:DNA-binding response OmpR family regulator